MSIRTRITLYGLAVVLAAVSCLSGGVYALVAGSVPRGQDKELVARTDLGLAQLAAAPAAAFTPGRSPAGVDPARDNDIFLLVLAADGTVISSGGPAGALPAPLLAAAGRDGLATATVSLAGVPVRVAVRPWHRADLGRSGYLVAAQAQRRQFTDRAGLGSLLVVVALVTLAVAGLAIWLVTRRALRPLRELTATADEVGRSPDRTRRLPPTPRDDDVGRLTGSFNAMLDRLEEAHRRTALALAAQQRFVADASHELRTPLATIRSNTGFLRAHPDAAGADRDAALADLDAEAVRMSRLVDDLLTLARADGGVRPSVSTVDFGALVHEVCRKAATSHPDRVLHCSGAPAVLSADAEALTRLLWILLDNAVRHTGDGGNIWVAVTAEVPPGGRTVATLQVADDGEGIPPGQEQRIFARFHQGDPARRRRARPGHRGLDRARAPGPDQRRQQRARRRHVHRPDRLDATAGTGATSTTGTRSAGGGGRPAAGVAGSAGTARAAGARPGELTGFLTPAHRRLTRTGQDRVP